MEVPSTKSMLGDFSGATAQHFGKEARFFRRDGDWFVRTEDQAGNPKDFRVAYSFGFYPLQQYLVQFSKGRFQVLPWCWDSRPKSMGGQRWFHIYPKQEIPAGDELHWTGINQNWNFMCAECHSTALRKNFDENTDSYDTSFAEIDVSCESCHGPGSTHATEANAGEKLSPYKATQESCMRCHTRRTVIREEPEHGQAFGDTHELALLTDPLYFADGQIRDEVYVFGSFLQTPMHAQGVKCKDCHDPHSLKLHRSGNNLCTTCHVKEIYDDVAHHFHEAGQRGSQCVDCHMRTRTYMVVDVRRDHSFRVPRPDLTVSIGTPNACDDCHEDKGARWAAAEIRKRFPKGRWTSPHFGEAFAAARRGDADAGNKLASVINNDAQAPIVRATAIRELEPFLEQEHIPLVQKATTDKDPLVRAAALVTLRELPERIRLPLAVPALWDKVRSVRIQAALSLVDLGSSRLPKKAYDRYRRAQDEVLESFRINADRPRTQVARGLYYVRQGRFSEAEAAYRKAIEQDPRLVIAYVNLADLYRDRGREDELRKLLDEALQANPGHATLIYVKALALARAKKYDEALILFQEAESKDPASAVHSHAYATALFSLGKKKEAVAVLGKALARHPKHRQLLQDLISIQRDRGFLRSALHHAKALLALVPKQRQIQAYVSELEEAVRKLDK